MTSELLGATQSNFYLTVTPDHSERLTLSKAAASVALSHLNSITV